MLAHEQHLGDRRCQGAQDAPMPRMTRLLLESRLARASFSISDGGLAVHQQEVCATLLRQCLRGELELLMARAQIDLLHELRSDLKH